MTVDIISMETEYFPLTLCSQRLWHQISSRIPQLLLPQLASVLGHLFVKSLFFRSCLFLLKPQRNWVFIFQFNWQRERTCLLLAAGDNVNTNTVCSKDNLREIIHGAKKLPERTLYYRNARYRTHYLACFKIEFDIHVPAGTWRSYNVAATSLQRHRHWFDVINVACPLGL